jgi:hypothetical protein
MRGAMLSALMGSSFLRTGPGTFTIEVLSGSGSWTVPAGVTSITHLLQIGGGGAGGTSVSGGGGAGEVKHTFSRAVTPGASLAYVVGQGGAASTGTVPIVGITGDDTTFDGIVAKGGGGAGAYSNTPVSFSPTSGGSGGGGGGSNYIPNYTGATAGVGLSNAGGRGYYNISNQAKGGGGGGAGGVGGDTSTTTSGDGGAGGSGLDLGAPYPYLSSYGVGGVFAGGGGGAIFGLTGEGGVGGSGGGGAGSKSTVLATQGTDGTGSGGGGGSGGTSFRNGARGGHGTIILAYYLP